MVEIASVIVLGIFAQWLAWRIKVPAILPLILIGLAVGPLSEFWYHNTSETGQPLKFLEPIWHDGRGLFPGQNLFYFVEIAIGLILFEGGLSLKREEIKEMGPAIIKLSFLVSPFVTFFGAAIVVNLLFNFSWQISFLFSSLIIVTGPTVISPILRNLKLKQNVSAVLKWEGILIDPVGALAAVLVFEFINSTMGGGELHGDHGSGFTSEAFRQFIQIVLIGLSVGFIGGFALRELLKRKWVPHYLLTVFTLAFVITIFVGSSLLVHDSGLLTVVVLGMVVGNIEMPHKEEIIYFKESITVLLISVLFILLSANINMADLKLLFDWRTLVLFLSIILLVRPLGVFLSTRGSQLSTKEKMFISWVGPRGIVAAGIASLFGLKLVQKGMPGAEYITPLVFMVVLGTVLLNATTAGWIAKMLGVLIEKSTGILILGANKGAQLIGQFLQANGKHVVLMDSNKGNVKNSEEIGLDAIKVDIYNDDLSSFLELNDMGYFMAMTGSAEVNEYALNKLKQEFGENGAYRLISVNEMRNPEYINQFGLFSKSDDFINFSEVSRDYPIIREYDVNNSEECATVLDKIRKDESSIPLFIRHKDGEIEIINSIQSEFVIQEGDEIIYMGNKIEELNQG